MPSVFETVTSLLGQGDNMAKLGGLVGADTGTTGKLVGAAAPALLGGIADRAAEPGGIGAVMGMLDGMDDSTVGDLSGFLDGGGNAAMGAGMLGTVFGDNQSSVIGALASQTGGGAGTITKLLPMLAPIVMGALRRRRADDGLDGAGMMSLLATEKADLDDKGLFDFGWMSKAGVGAGAAAAVAGVAGAGRNLAGAAGGVVDGATGAAGSTVDRAAGAVDGATGAARGAAGAARDGVRDVAAGGSGNGKGWLPWLIGGLAAVLLLAWALSQCGGGDSVDTNAIGDAAEDATDAVEDAADDAADAAGDAASDAADAVEDSETEDSEVEDGAGDMLDLDAMQPEVDSALLGTGIAGLQGVIGDDGVVLLTGTVDSDEAKAAAEAAVADIDGVTGIDNQITVEAVASETDEENAEPETINDELSLDPITFEVSSARITAEGQTVLDQAADYLNANVDVNVEIAGHTDADGDEAANLALSQARAESVKAYLEGKGIDGNRMTPKGYGEAQPVASNDTPEGKAQNRRIEFVIQ